MISLYSFHSIYQEDKRNQDILNEKLTLLNRKEQHDPVLALGRDNVYEEELWEEHFDEWESGKDSSFDHLVKSNASQLCDLLSRPSVELGQAWKNESYALKMYPMSYNLRVPSRC